MSALSNMNLQLGEYEPVYYLATDLPKDRITPEALARRMRGIADCQGSVIRVQVFDGPTLLSEGEFRVTHWSASTRRVASDDGARERTLQEPSCIVEQKGAWFDWQPAVEEAPVAPSDFPNDDGPQEPLTAKIEVPDGEPGATVKWNPGRKLHEVIREGEVIFSTADKAEAESVARLGKAPAALENA